MDENKFILIVVGIVAVVGIVGILNSNISGDATSTSKGEIVYCDKAECEASCSLGSCDWYQTNENVCGYKIFTDQKGETWHQYWKCG